MRVLHFYKTSFPDSMGGVEQVINQIAIGSIKLGVMSDVLTLTSKNLPRSVNVNGYSVHRAKMDLEIASTGFSTSAILQFAELAKKADVIHYHFPWPFMDLVHFLARVDKPTIVTYHSDIVRQKYLLNLYRPLMWRFLGDVSRIVATSPNYLLTSDILRRFKSKVNVIPIGIDKETYIVPSLERIKYWRERLAEKFFLFVGVIRYYKGLHILIEAIRGLDYPIVIVGAGPIEEELKAKVEELGIRNILFLGHLPEIDKNALLMLCYCVLFPSHLRSEAFGVSLLEGAMFGKPMISSEIGTGTTYINIANKTGLVVPPSDPFSLRQAICTMWGNPKLAEEMGREAELRYRENFTADRMANDYVNLYHELLGK